MKEEQQGHKIFVEQAMHEVHKGAFDLAIYYLMRAIRVSAGLQRAQSFTYLMKNLQRDKNRVSSFSRCLIETFP